MPKIESVKIGKNNFTFINGLPVGWFINNKPVFFSPQSDLTGHKERGGIRAALSLESVAMTETALIELGGMFGEQVGKHIYESKHDASGQIIGVKLSATGIISPRLFGGSGEQYPWTLRYEIKTTLAESFLSVRVKINRADSNNFITSPIINPSLYAYFNIGKSGFVTAEHEGGLIFPKEDMASFIRIADCFIESAGGDVEMSVKYAEGVYLHSHDFNQQGCIQPIFSSTRGCGGEEGIELAPGKSLKLKISLELQNQ